MPSSSSASSRLYVSTLITGMILTGACNSLWSKYQDMQCVENCDDPNPKNHVLYEQPVLQTLQMFLGEMLCFLPVIYTWLASKRQSTAPLRLTDDDDDDNGDGAAAKQDQPHGLHGWSILLMWLPAACDLTGTTLMMVGLLYTPVSIYQMTRGALVLFVGAFSVVFLRRRLWLYQWIALVTVMAGVTLVGFSGSLVKETIQDDQEAGFVAGTLSALGSRAAAVLTASEAGEKPEATNVVLGVFFILFAQVFTAAQFVIEEKIMGKYAVPPLIAVGLEGFFGFITILLLTPILTIPAVASKSTFFDIRRGWNQTIYTPSVLWSGVVVALSIAFFNFFGLSVTRHVSATARSLTDTCRTLAIWVVSLALGWEFLVWPISVLQVAGFSLLVYGTFWFNDLVKAPPCIPHPASYVEAAEPGADEEEARGLLNEQLDDTATLPADLGQSGFNVVPSGSKARVTTADEQ